MEQLDQDEADATWREADLLAGHISAMLVAHGIERSREAALALVLIAADDVVKYDAADEEAFAATARSAYRIRMEHAAELERLKEAGA